MAEVHSTAKVCFTDDNCVPLDPGLNDSYPSFHSVVDSGGDSGGSDGIIAVTVMAASAAVVVVEFIIITNPLTPGAPQMILQPVFSIFPCSPLPALI